MWRYLYFAVFGAFLGVSNSREKQLMLDSLSRVTNMTGGLPTNTLWAGKPSTQSVDFWQPGDESPQRTTFHENHLADYISEGCVKVQERQILHSPPLRKLTLSGHLLWSSNIQPTGTLQTSCSSHELLGMIQHIAWQYFSIQLRTIKLELPM